MSASLEIVIEPSGCYGAIYDDVLIPYFEALGPVATVRAAHVEPEPGGWGVELEPWVEPEAGLRHYGPVATRALALWIEGVCVTAALKAGRYPHQLLEAARH